MTNCNYQPLLEIGIEIRQCTDAEVVIKKAFQHPTLDDAVYVVEKVMCPNDPNCITNDREPHLFDRYKVICVPKGILAASRQLYVHWVFHEYPKDKFLVCMDKVHDLNGAVNLIVKNTTKGTF